MTTANLTVKTPSAETIELFEAQPGISVLLAADGPKYTTLAATDDYLQSTGWQREQIIGVGHLDLYPVNPDDPEGHGENVIRKAYNKASQLKQEQRLTLRYDIPDGTGGFSERYWAAVVKPVIDKTGEVKYLIHSASDITSEIEHQQLEERVKGLERANEIFMHTPVSIAILKGNDFVIELANDPIIEVWGKGAGVVGKPIKEALPEIQEQGFVQLMEKVVAEEKPFQAYEMPVWLIRNGVREQIYFNFTYQPYYERAGTKPVGIIIFANEVTNEVNTRLQLATKEQSLELAVEIGELGIFSIDFACENLYECTATYSNRIKEWFYLPEFSTTLQEFAKRQHPDDLPVVMKEMERSLSGLNDGKHDVTYRIVNPDGTFRHLRSIGKVIFGEDKRPKLISGIIQDVTEQVKNHNALKESEQQIRSFIESSPFPVGIYIGKEMIIAFANKTIIDIFGKGDDVIGKSYKEILPELGSQQIFDQLDHVYTTGEPFHAKNQRVDLEYNGEIQTLYFSYSFTPLYDAEGKVYGVMNTAADVTDLVVAKQKVEESELHLQARVQERTAELEEQRNLLNNILVNSSNGISVTEIFKDEKSIPIDLQTVLANDAAVRFVGLPREIYLSKKASEVVPDLFQSDLWKAYLAVLSTGKPEIAQYYFEPAKRWLELTISKMDDSHLINIFTDITPIKEAQLQLERSVKELQKSNANLEEFAYAASHDMKEPIRKIHFFSDRLQSSLAGKLSDNDVKIFERMQSATHRMNSLIDDLLSYSEVSIKPRQFELVDLNRLLQQVITDLDLEIEQRKAVVQIELLPAVYGHQRQLQQVFLNIIGNALKYVHHDRAPEVKIISRKASGSEFTHVVKQSDITTSFYLIEIRDNGIGFETKDAERIFNVFTRLHGNAEFRGTGVGLSIVRKVMENHNGYVWAESEYGKSSKFYLLIPEASSL